MLYLITNRKIVKKESFIGVIEQAVYGGVDVIILREKDLSIDELFPLALKIREITKNNGVKLVINHHLEVAKEVHADGFHTSYENFMKTNIDFPGIIGVSIHHLQEAKKVEKKANYLLAGHVFETDSKKGLKPRGISFIENLKQEVHIPIVALGGIHLHNIEQLLIRGIDHIAVMSAIMSSEDPYQTTKDLKNKMKKFNHQSEA
ncbi:thiamine phosphate synthase [Tepidibacillus sp. LV47]|uniref:thiamine phosphate synthase n=1 Tax=Tepidibacillus sp. LV47 TaxID=3398228 RepID=UPI003AAAC0D8